MGLRITHINIFFLLDKQKIFALTFVTGNETLITGNNGGLDVGKVVEDD